MEASTSLTPAQYAKNPGVLYFLPILYIAWADAVLTKHELNTIQQVINRQTWLNDAEKKILYGWMNPENPPSPVQMKLWLNVIRKHANAIRDKNTIAEIGLQIAQFNHNNSTNEKVAKLAIQDIEDALGIIGNESLNNLVNPFIPSPEASPKASSESGFNTSLLSAFLDGEEKEIIARVKKLLSTPTFKYPAYENTGAYREQVYQWCKILAKEGLGGIAYPKQYGGGGDMGSYFAVMETLSYHDFSMVIKFGVQFGLFGMSIYFLGTEKHHKRYLGDIATLALPGCFAMTETGHGSNVRDIETTATYDPDNDGFIIHTPHHDAGKEYIGNAALHGRMATVFAQLIINGVSYGVSALLVPLRHKDGRLCKGVTIKDCGDKMGLNGVDNGRIWFDQVHIPRENLLDRFAKVTKDGVYESPIASDSKRFFTMLGTLVGGRIGIPRAGLSATKSALTIAIRYAAKRRQFGAAGKPEQPILDYRTHQRRLMPLLANTYALHFSLQYLTQRYLAKSDADEREIEALAAGIKAYATWNTTETLQTCREACGGKGYLSENRIPALKADTDVFTTFEGDNTVLMQLVAKSRLGEFKQEFHEINFFGLLKYVADQASTAISELNPIVTRKTDDNHLLDTEFHLAAFRYRERDILRAAAQRLKALIDDGIDSFEAFNQCQYHMLNVGFAYVERVVLEEFVNKVSQADQSLKPILKKLCELYALSQIEKNKGWYLEHGYMEGIKTKAIRRMVNRLCEEVKNNAVNLVNAFDIPEQCLSAPIATRNVKY